MYPRSPKASGARAASLGSALALLVLLSGCMYSLVGGGLPGHIRTMAVTAFENQTTQPLLESDIQRAMQGQLPRDLGVRLAEEGAADAVIRGRITGYEEVATSVRPSTGGIDQQDQTVPVLQRQVRISYQAEIYDRREDKPIWRGQGQSVIGNFLPDRNETPQQGRTRAIQELVKKVVEGAQSQW